MVCISQVFKIASSDLNPFYGTKVTSTYPFHSLNLTFHYIEPNARHPV